MLVLCAAIGRLHAFEELNGLSPGNQYRNYSGTRIKVDPLCRSEGVKWKSKFLGRTTEQTI